MITKPIPIYYADTYFLFDRKKYRGKNIKHKIHTFNWNNIIGAFPQLLTKMLQRCPWSAYFQLYDFESTINMAQWKGGLVLLSKCLLSGTM